MENTLCMPPKVQGLSADLDEEGRINLKWLPLRLKLFPVINYKVQILPSKMVLWSQSFSYCTKTPNLNIRLPEGKYKLRVRANSRLGLGSPSDEIYIHIGGERRERVVRNLTNQEKQSGSGIGKTPKQVKNRADKEQQFHLKGSFHHFGGACGYTANESSPSHSRENTASSCSGKYSHQPDVQAGYSYGSEAGEKGYGGANTGADAGSFHHFGGACGYTANKSSPSHSRENTASSCSGKYSHQPDVQAGYSYGSEAGEKGYGGANTGADAGSFHHFGGACGYTANESSPSHSRENTASSCSGKYSHQPDVQAGYSYGSEAGEKGYGGANTGADAGSFHHFGGACGYTANESSPSHSRENTASSCSGNKRYKNLIQRAEVGTDILQTQIMEKKDNIGKLTHEIENRKALLAEITGYEGYTSLAKDNLPIRIREIENLKKELQILTDEEENLSCQLESLNEAISKKIEANLIEDEKVIGQMSQLEELLKELGL